MRLKRRMVILMMIMKMIRLCIVFTAIIRFRVFINFNFILMIMYKYSKFYFMMQHSFAYEAFSSFYDILIKCLRQ